MQRTVVRGGRETCGSTAGTERPSEWPGPGLNLRALASVGCAVLVGVFAAGAAWSAMHDASRAESRFYAILAVLMFLTAAFGAAYWRPQRPVTRVRYEQRGERGVTVVPARGAVFGLLVTMIACAAALSLGAAVEVLLFNEGLPWVSVVLALWGVPPVMFLVEVAAGRVRAGALTLGPDGIRHRGWFVESYLPWRSVADVQAVYHGFPEIWVVGTSSAAWARRRTSRVFRLDRLPDTPRIEVDSRRFDVDAVLLHRILVFYTRSPKCRGELGSRAAAERIRRGDLGVTTCE